MDDSVDVIDGATGHRLGRAPFPASGVQAYVDPRHCEGGTHVEPSGFRPITRPVIDARGRYQVFLAQTSFVNGIPPGPNGPCGNPGDFPSSFERQVARFSIDGTSASFSVVHTDTSATDYFSVSDPVVDSEGGGWVRTVASHWNDGAGMWDDTTAGWYFGNGVAHQTEDPGFVPTVVGESRRGFGIGPSGGLVAFDLSQGTLWTSSDQPGISQLIAEAGGGVLAITSSGTAEWLSPEGTFIESAALPLPVALPAMAGAFVGADSNGVSMVRSIEIQPGFEFQAGVGNAQGQGRPGGLFDTADLAAIAVLQYFNPASIEFNREYAGSICRGVTAYSVTVPSRGDYSDRVPPSICSVPQSFAGAYHTHGMFGNRGLSAYDQQDRADRNPGVPWYVGDPCGEIRKYVGPNGFLFLPPGDLVPIIGARIGRTAVPPSAPLCRRYSQ